MTKIAANTGSRSLRKLQDYFLLPKPGLRLPSHDSIHSIGYRFGSFFSTKISTLRAYLAATAAKWSPEVPLPLPSSLSFKSQLT